MGTVIGARVDDDLVDTLDHYADANGVDRSKAIETLLRDALDDADPNDGRPLEARVTALETRVDALENTPLWERIFP